MVTQQKTKNKKPKKGITKKGELPNKKGACGISLLEASGSQKKLKRNPDRERGEGKEANHIKIFSFFIFFLPCAST
jgi:hypothetical protein